MRLEFDTNGYVCTVVFGCETGSCTEYTGTVPKEPEEYSSYADWADRAKIQAYYLDKNGNLAYDAVRAASIPAEDEITITPYTSEQLKALGILDAIRYEIETTIFDAIYPVGSIYISMYEEGPQALFGGEWEQIKDKFILAAGSTYSAGSTGGAKSYDLSVAHKHVAPLGYSGTTAVGAIAINGTVSTGSGKTYRTAKVDYSGSSLSSNITALYTGNTTVSATIPTIPPYLAVYVWQRIA